MRSRVGGIILGSLCALLPAAAQAQAAAYDESLVRGFGFNIGGTLAAPVGDSADRVDLGWGFTLGATYNVNPRLGLQLEYGATWANLETGSLQAADIAGNAAFHYFNLNAVLTPVRQGRAGLYFVGGGGLYYRAAEVTRIEGTALAPYCDPWLYYCSAVPVTVESVLGSRDSWDWGLDAGIGFAFAVAPPVRFYLEVRYHYVFGPSFQDESGNERSADGQYVPFTLGVRF